MEQLQLAASNERPFSPALQLGLARPARSHTDTHTRDRGEEWEVHLRGRVDPVASSLSSRTEEGQRSRFMFLFLAVRRCAGWVLLGLCLVLSSRTYRTLTHVSDVCLLHTHTYDTHTHKPIAIARPHKQDEKTGCA